ncbi:MAG: PorT family protein [Flavobacteriales bacterium]|nr:PorT family protein [Flavobacteriales bacterium]
MKKLFTLSFVLFLAFQVNAQIKIGVKAGVLTSSFDFSNVSSEITEIRDGSTKLGYHFGAILRIGDERFLEISPSIVNYKTEFSLKTSSLIEAVATQQQYALDIPVNVGFKALGFIDLFAGPRFSINLRDKLSISSVLEEVEQEYKTASIGLQAGVGIRIAKFMVDVRYNDSISKIADQITIGDANWKAEARATSVQGSITLFF